MKEMLVLGYPVYLVVVAVAFTIVIVSIVCGLVLIYHLLQLVQERELDKENKEQEPQIYEMMRETSEPAITCKKVARFEHCMV